MNAPAYLLPGPRRIAVLRALQLGDLLQAVPALRALRSGFPAAEITLIGLPWAESFTRRFSRYIDRFVEFAGFPGIAEVEAIPERTTCFIEKQRAYSYDLVIQMHGSGRTSNACALALGGAMTVGYYDPPAEDAMNGAPTEEPAKGAMYCAPTKGLTLAAPYPDDQPEVLRNLGLAKLLGCQGNDVRLEFPLFHADRAEAAALLRRLPRAHRPWIGLHAGARSPARRWPGRYFAQVADELALRYNAQVLLTGSSEDEAIAQSVAEQMTTQPLNLAGQTSLGGLAALISELDLFISNDTGPAHIANALDTPSVTIFGPVDYRRWAALDSIRHPIARRPVVCSPCGYWECPIDHRCLRWLQPEMVIEAAERVLRQTSVLREQRRPIRVS